MNNKTYAKSYKRFLAFLIDCVILFFLDILIGIIVNPSGGKVNAQFGINFNFSSPEKAISNFVNISYFIILTALWGATLGKRILGVKVISVEEQNTPTFGQVFLRETVGKLISTIVLGLGFIWILFDNRKQGWHDKIAKTLVVSN